MNIAQRARGTDEIKNLNGATLALVEQYQRRLDTLEAEVRMYQELVQGYKESVEHSFGEVVRTQDAICAALQHLPLQLQQLLPVAQPIPVAQPPQQRQRRRRHRHRNRRRHSPPTSSSSEGEEEEDDPSAPGDSSVSTGRASAAAADAADMDAYQDYDENDNNDHDDDGDDDGQDPPAADVAAAGAPTAPVAAVVVPPPATAIQERRPRPMTINDRLMATARVPNFNTAMPTSVVDLLADWRLMELEKYTKVKGRVRLWGNNRAQSYGKREFLMGIIRKVAPNVPRVDARALTQVEKEDMAATLMDQRRVDKDDTMSNYYDHWKRTDPKVKKRKKKTNTGNEAG